MLKFDFEESPAQYVAQNLITEISNSSDLTYEEQAVDEGFVTGPSSFEEIDGQYVKATMEGYERKCLVEIKELPFDTVIISTRVYDSPSEVFEKRKIGIEVEKPNEHHLSDPKEAQQKIYKQIREDCEIEKADKATEIEIEDSLILEYSWEH